MAYFNKNASLTEVKEASNPGQQWMVLSPDNVM
jgi:hypothetical protein